MIIWFMIGLLVGIIYNYMNKLSKKRRIKIHYGYDVFDIFGAFLFSIKYDKFYNKKGKLKEVKVDKNKQNSRK